MGEGQVDTARLGPSSALRSAFDPHSGVRGGCAQSQLQHLQCPVPSENMDLVHKAGWKCHSKLYKGAKAFSLLSWSLCLSLDLS